LFPLSSLGGVKLSISSFSFAVASTMFIITGIGGRLTVHALLPFIPAPEVVVRPDTLEPEEGYTPDAKLLVPEELVDMVPGTDKFEFGIDFFDILADRVVEVVGVKWSCQCVNHE
jgi:hypothetical protein